MVSELRKKGRKFDKLKPFKRILRKGRRTKVTGKRKNKTQNRGIFLFFFVFFFLIFVLVCNEDCLKDKDILCNADRTQRHFHIE